MTEKEMELHYQNLEKELAEYDSRVSEMAKEISESNILCKNCGDYGDTYCTEAIANTLYKAGYRKLPEGAVVLTSEQYSNYLILQTNHEFIREKAKELQADNERLYKNLGKFKESVEKETLEKIKLTPIECGEEIGYYYLDIRVTGKELIQRVYFNSDFIDGKVRKETAKEILKAVLEDVGEFYAGDIVEELAEQYGVEVEE